MLIIYTEDVGMGDLGCYGADLIKTPNLDAIAENPEKLKGMAIMLQKIKALHTIERFLQLLSDRIGITYFITYIAVLSGTTDIDQGVEEAYIY